MAGSHAGQSFNTYPLMNGKIIPDDIYLAEMGILNLFENTVTINFNHRWIATLTFVYTFSLFLYLFISKITGLQKSIIVLVLLILSLQFFLGIMALLSNVGITIERWPYSGRWPYFDQVGMPKFLGLLFFWRRNAGGHRVREPTVSWSSLMDWTS